MDGYLSGAASQLMERGRVLTAKIPRDLPRDYDTLAQTCRKRINIQLEHLHAMADDPLLRESKYQPERFRLFKRIVAELDIIETVGIAALDRANSDDHKLNELLERIAREIHYPLETPVVTTLSQQYFHIYPDMNLLCVPLTEGRFLLHLPDLYHELAHPLLSAQNDPIVEPFQAQFLSALSDALKYISTEKSKEDRRRGPRQPGYLLQIWEIAWVKYWMTEFFCDLFAAYTLGPAFAWSHFHLAAKRGSDPFHVPINRSTSHPADDARMRAILHALDISRFKDQAAKVHECWRSYLLQCAARPEPEYHRCYPDHLIRTIAERTRDGVIGMQARICSEDTKDPIHALLNEAWIKFWAAPDCYVTWEKQAVNRLFDSRSPTPTIHDS